MSDYKKLYKGDNGYAWASSPKEARDAGLVGLTVNTNEKEQTYEVEGGNNPRLVSIWRGNPSWMDEDGTFFAHVPTSKIVNHPGNATVYKNQHHQL